MMPGRLARAHESGDSVPAQWDGLRTAEEFFEGRLLVEAAYADGRFAISSQLSAMERYGLDR